MEKREDALQEALEQNEADTEHWIIYKKDCQTAIENLNMISKHLTVDVMVPIGSKAFVPGQLIHTNEVLVAHYQGYYSKCSAHKAKEICEYRICMADERLEKLKAEAELWENKLKAPYLEGALPAVNEREIIEDYDEAKEKKWREGHKERVRREKLIEKDQRAKGETTQQEKTDEEIFKMLEEAEMMEELQNELESLDVDEINDETIQKLMSGEIKLPNPPQRIEHKVLDKVVQNEKLIEPIPGVVKKSELNAEVVATNNNSRTNPEISMNTTDTDDNNQNDGDYRLPEEVEIIKNQAKYLPTEDQIGFYEFQMQIINEKIAKLQSESTEEMEKKVELYLILEHLEELLEAAEDKVECKVTTSNVESIDHENTKENCPKIEESQPKRRISFALEDQTIEFYKNRAVSDLLPKSQENPDIKEHKRDIIKLDDDVMSGSKVDVAATTPPMTKREAVLSKVNECLNRVTEQQSINDFDLVNRIMESSENKDRTLTIKFTHSKNQAIKPIPEKADETEAAIPGTPADFYEMFLKMLPDKEKSNNNVVYVNSFLGEEDVKTPILREAQRESSYVNPKEAFSKTNGVKSILRNKSAVEKEEHNFPNNNDQKEKSIKSKPKNKKRDEPQDFIYESAYEKVMHDVIEKVPIAPDPLPQEPFIDAHTPKKRISRFKQMRSMAEKT